MSSGPSKRDSLIPSPVGSGISTTSTYAYSMNLAGFSLKNNRPALIGCLSSGGEPRIFRSLHSVSIGSDRQISDFSDPILERYSYMRDGRMSEISAS